MIQPGPALIFLHIPKAAGTTLHSIIADNYNAEEMFTVAEEAPRRVEDLEAMTAEQKAGFRVVKGHFSFGIHETLPQSSIYITLFREPVDRVISHYYYVLRRTSHPLHQRVASQKLTLRQYAESGTVQDNGQVRFIAGADILRPCGLCTREMLDKAKENLDRHFVVAGLAERFDEAIILCRRRFSWKHPFYWSQNVTKDRPLREAFAAQDLETVRHINSLDCELYEHAEKLFNKAIDDQEGFAEELKQFQRANVLFGQEKQCQHALAGYRRRLLPWVFWPGAWKARRERNAIRKQTRVFKRKNLQICE